MSWISVLKITGLLEGLEINSCHTFGSFGEAPRNVAFHNLAMTANIYTEHFINNETSISFVPLLDKLRASETSGSQM
jgi:hypothetical protein